MNTPAPRITVDTKSTAEIVKAQEVSSATSEATAEGIVIEYTLIHQLVTKTKHTVTIKIPFTPLLENGNHVTAQDARR